MGAQVSTESASVPIPIIHTPSVMSPIRTIAGEFSGKKALELLYGETAVINDDSGVVYVECQSAFLAKLEEPLSTTVRINLVAQYRQNDTDKYVIITAASPSDSQMHCHACPAVIGGAVFFRAGNTWQIEVEQEYITSIGSFAFAPPGELVRIGPDEYGILFRDSYVGQGYYTNWFYIIAVVEGYFTRVLTLATAAGPVFDDRDTASYSSEIEFIQGEDSTYYDMRVVTNGTKFEGGEIVYFEEEKIFEFSLAEHEFVENDN
jgi:hypothetical protein